MFLSKPNKLALIFSALALASTACYAQVNQEYIAHQEEVKSATLGQEVCIYGYPLVMMNTLKGYDTYARSAREYRAPINQFAHAKRQPTPLDTQNDPNIDVLTSNGWLDLSNGPLVFHVPAIYKRFFLFELFDGWTNIVTTIDPSVTDAKEKNFMICGPDFKGSAPKNVALVRSRTTMVYIRGLTQCFGPEDYNNIYTLQNSYTLTPLSKFGKPYSPPAMLPLANAIATKQSAADQLSDMSFITFFNRFAALIKKNPPCTQDIAMCKTMAKLGIDPEKSFDAEDINRNVENGLEDAFSDAIEKINDDFNCVITTRNQWKMILRKESDFGTDYTRRAMLARASLPVSLSQNILAASSNADSNGNRLNGLNRYKIHLKKEEIPPAKAFWSLTLYTGFNHLAYNSANVYAIQSFADSLKMNEDGSCDIYIQRDKPTDPHSNWLPCPKEPFSLMLRLYQPQPKAVDGEWIPPSVICRDPM